ncbi:hypothetical protein K8B33_13505 [Alcanivorax sp. JB21]|uniref:hypothetical protein n=1 Tax=Alcanivorax limicola TaxID=2874102 RepID=UPI001CBEDE32|nr:hypothetical protein [Alcanivorax limicola]MBZ2190119.1 hypothetical protein [Alcanivorax limicola]
MIEKLYAVVAALIGPYPVTAVTALHRGDMYSPAAISTPVANLEAQQHMEAFKPQQLTFLYDIFLDDFKVLAV